MLPRPLLAEKNKKRVTSIVGSLVFICKTSVIYRNKFNIMYLQILMSVIEYPYTSLNTLCLRREK